MSRIGQKAATSILALGDYNTFQGWGSAEIDQLDSLSSSSAKQEFQAVPGGPWISDLPTLKSLGIYRDWHEQAASGGQSDGVLTEPLGQLAPATTGVLPYQFRFMPADNSLSQFKKSLRMRLSFDFGAFGSGVTEDLPIDVYAPKYDMTYKVGGTGEVGPDPTGQDSGDWAFVHRENLVGHSGGMIFSARVYPFTLSELNFPQDQVGTLQTTTKYSFKVSGLLNGVSTDITLSPSETVTPPQRKHDGPSPYGSLKPVDSLWYEKDDPRIRLDQIYSLTVGVSPPKLNSIAYSEYDFEAATYLTFYPSNGSAVPLQKFTWTPHFRLNFNANSSPQWAYNANLSSVNQSRPGWFPDLPVWVGWLVH